MSYKLLVVDDDHAIIRTFKRIFKASDYQLQSAHSGEEALKRVQAFYPDIILLDITMPGMDGYEVCRKIRSFPDQSLAKILFISGHADLKDRLKGYESGANDYITKPFDNFELKAKVDVFCQLKYAEEVNQLKGDFLRLLSHEQNTPLNAILGFSQIMELDDNLTPVQQEHLSHIKKAGEELLEKTQKILKFSELKNLKTIVKKNFSVQLIINDCIKKITAKQQQKHLTIEVLSSEESQVSLDPFLITDAITQILDNAVQYSPEQGKITIKVNKEKDDCSITITDQGRGISEKNLGDIFEPFSNRDIYHHSRGIRLGLAFSKQAIELHHGSLTIQNEKQGGLTVKIKLPL